MSLCWREKEPFWRAGVGLARVKNISWHPWSWDNSRRERESLEWRLRTKSGLHRCFAWLSGHFESFMAAASIFKLEIQFVRPVFSLLFKASQNLTTRVYFCLRTAVRSILRDTQDPSTSYSSSDLPNPFWTAPNSSLYELGNISWQHGLLVMAILYCQLDEV